MDSSLRRTILPVDASAAVWSPRDGFYVLLSSEAPSDEARALLACVDRLISEPRFQDEMLAWQEQDLG